MSDHEFQAPVAGDALFQAEVDRVMDDGELPAQLNEVHRMWPETMEHMLILRTAVELRLHLRGVFVGVEVPYRTWPAQPPVLTVHDMPWVHPNIRFSGHIVGLDGQSAWNRTVTLADLIREVEQRFIERPPQQRFRLGATLHRFWRQWRGTDTD